MPSDNQFSISDVSQQTGVASITLRAWERRYGLVKPQRTPKGHRVYSQDNIDEIKQILSWLNRGVTISKVAPLLGTSSPRDKNSIVDQHWQDHVQEMLTALIELKQITANQLCDKLTKTIPFHTLCQQVYQPLSQLLAERWQHTPLGYQLEQQVWQQLWQRQITLMSLRADKQKARASCWLVNTEQGHTHYDYWLLYGLLIQAGIRVHAITANASVESLARLDHQADRGLIVVANNRLDIAALTKLIDLKTNWQQRLLCVGAAVDIHQNELQNNQINYVAGDSCLSWQSTIMQQWLKQIELG
ncbi:MAG: MerR family transcriptional regulator [Gammaproteobacteria bacterium]|nr:MerR family transcriptional regulator [Gammaproteobacteria bacterium]